MNILVIGTGLAVIMAVALVWDRFNDDNRRI